MKNQLTLIIATFLLILCVFEKQASIKALRRANVEKMYNFPAKSIGNGLLNTPIEAEMQDENIPLYNPASLYEFASLDSTSGVQKSVRLLDQSPLNISFSSKMID